MTFLTKLTTGWLYFNCVLLITVTLCYLVFPAAAISSGNPFSKEPDPLSKFDRYSINSTECGAYAVYGFLFARALMWGPPFGHTLALQMLTVYSVFNVGFGVDSYFRVGFDDHDAENQMYAMMGNFAYLVANAGLLLMSRRLYEASDMSLQSQALLGV